VVIFAPLNAWDYGSEHFVFYKTSKNN